MKHNQTSKSPFYLHVFLIDVFEMMAMTTITCQNIPISLELHGFPHVPAVQWDGQFLQEWRRSCTNGGGGAVYSTDSLVSASHYKRSIARHSDGGEVILAGGSATCGRAAFRHHSDLGAEVEAVACHWGLLVLGISSQKSLHVPPPPLSFNLRLNLDSVWMRSGKRKLQLLLLKIFMITRNKFSHVFPNIWLVV